MQSLDLPVSSLYGDVDPQKELTGDPQGKGLTALLLQIGASAPLCQAYVSTNSTRRFGTADLLEEGPGGPEE